MNEAVLGAVFLNSRGASVLPSYYFNKGKMREGDRAPVNKYQDFYPQKCNLFRPVLDSIAPGSPPGK